MNLKVDRILLHVIMREGRVAGLYTSMAGRIWELSQPQMYALLTMADLLV